MSKFLAQIRLSTFVAMQYRIEYLLTMFSVTVSAVVEIGLWRMVLKERQEISGFTLTQFITYLVIANSVAMLRVNWSNLFEFSEEIRSGRITRHLLKPMSMYQIVTADWLAGKIPLVVGTALVLLGVHFFNPTEFAPSLLQILLFVISMGFSIWLSSQLYFLVFCLGFFIAENSSVIIALNVFGWGFIGMAFPLSFYPEWLFHALQFTPFPYFVYYPVMGLMGRLPVNIVGEKILLAAGFCALFWIFRALAWRKVENHLQVVGG